MRAELLERYQAIPLADEVGRALALHRSRGIRPRQLHGGRRRRAPSRRRRCSRSTRPASPRSARPGSRSSTRPRASASSCSTDDHPLLGTLVGHGEKFAAHNAAMWEHGLLVHVPKGVVVDKPLYIRIANAVEGGSLFWRLLIVAEAQSRFTVIEEYASAVARALRLLERRGRDRRRGRRQGRVRVGPESLPEHLALRLASRHGRPRRRARLGRGRLRLGRRQGVDPERPRRPGRDVAGDRRLLRRPRAAARLRHLPGAHRSRTRRPTSRSRACSATPRAPSGAG